MLHIITSNRTEFTSVKEDIENFVIVHSYDKRIKNPVIYSNTTEEYNTKIFYTVYHKNGMDLSEEIESYENTIEISSIPCESFQEALDKIKSKIVQVELSESKMVEEDEYLEDRDIAVTIASDPVFSRLVKQYLDKKFRSSQIPVECFNMIEYMQADDIRKLGLQVKMNLGVTVYEDDPISFSYVIREMY